ncbi:hypothetical protein [uncultured Tateyamaria sp.]|uniref:hypothetical protein n=1 Tax=uncultured Tateyamaria sp. TaxID=455651 RepID=UPI00261CDE5D|nr:hypothetical protein [uncultured Tateyamaria sp.]
MRLTLALVFPLTLIACTEVVSEREGTFNYRGETLRAVTREYSTNGNTFTKRVIYDGNRPVSCSATDDADCRAALSYEKLDRND